MGRRFPDCTRCRLPQHEADRIRWGCDTPSDRPVFEIGCGTCYGRDLACARCGGRGVLELYRCPSATLAKAPPKTQLQLDLFMRAYLHYEGRQTLPVDGGLLDQSRSFVAACEIVDGERARFELLKEEKRERDRQAAQRRSLKHGK